MFATLCEGLSGSSSPRCSINCFSDGEAHIKVLLGSVQAYFTKSRQWQVLTVLYIGNEQTPADDHSEYSVLALNLRDIGTGLSYGTIGKNRPEKHSIDLRLSLCIARLILNVFLV